MRSASPKLSNLAKRVIVAAVSAPLLLLGVFWSPYAFFGLFLFVSTVTLFEFYRLLATEVCPPRVIWGLSLAVLVYATPFMVKINLLPQGIYMVLFPASALVFLSELYRKGDTKPFTHLAYTFIGIVYVALPFAMLHFIAFYGGTYEPRIIAGILLLTWASDTGGYFAGRYFGRTKLFERVSPKKTWEGFVGSALLSLLIAWAVYAIFGVLPLWKWMVLGGLAITAGTFGDLVESLLKRSIHIKDSGSLLPGHGGFLDRFDAMLISLPFMAAFLELF